jgi:hypothetical protein
MTPMRYAVYFAPAPDHPLWQAGCDWLQRDPSGDDTHVPTRPHVREPWRYGFHATLKPPMRLAPGRDEAGLVAAIGRIARATPRFAMPRLSVQWLSGFLALRPAEPLPRHHRLHWLADACVTELDGWRAPPGEDELRRRLAQPLDAARQQALMRWGYPHVLDHWQFHMTLSDGLADLDIVARERLHAEAQHHFATALAQPLVCDALSVFVEHHPGEPLRLVQRVPLA